MDQDARSEGERVIAFTYSVVLLNYMQWNCLCYFHCVSKRKSLAIQLNFHYHRVGNNYYRGLLILYPSFEANY